MQFNFSRFVIAVLVLAFGISACGRGVIPPLPQDETDKSATEAVIRYVPPPVKVTIYANHPEPLVPAVTNTTEEDVPLRLINGKEEIDLDLEEDSTPTAADNKPEEFDLELEEDTTATAVQENIDRKLPDLVSEKCVPLVWNIGGRAFREVCAMFIGDSKEPLLCVMKLNRSQTTEYEVDCDVYTRAFCWAPKK